MPSSSNNAIRLLVLSGAVLFASAASAALPPHYQRADELRAIIDHVVEAFGISQPIDSIVLTETDTYEVTGGDCHMQVRVVDAPKPHPDGFVGPREFAVESGEVICE